MDLELFSIKLFGVDIKDNYLENFNILYVKDVGGKGPRQDKELGAFGH